MKNIKYFSFEKQKSFLKNKTLKPFMHEQTSHIMDDRILRQKNENLYIEI